MAENEPTLTVDEAAEGDVTPAPEAAPEPAMEQAGERSSSFPYDEQTLGRSTSVFDAGVELLAPTPPPVVMAPPTAAPHVDKPMSAGERRRRVRLEARRVRRVVRHIEPWSVLKVSVIFYACLWLVFLLAGVLLWSFAERSGTLTSIEDLIEDLFQLDPEEDFWSGSTIFRSYAIATLFLSVAGVAFNVLLCVMYNLISDLTGGIRMTVIEEESARFRPPPRRRRR